MAPAAGPAGPLRPTDVCVAQMYGWVDSPGVKGAGSLSMRVPVVMHCGAETAAQLPRDFYAVVAANG